MKSTIEINCDNAAFSDCAGDEIARILRELADEIELDSEPDSCILRDVNGNRVGKFTFEL